MKLEGSLQYSQKPAILAFLELIEYSHTHTHISFSGQFWYCPPVCPLRSLFFRFSI